MALIGVVFFLVGFGAFGAWDPVVHSVCDSGKAYKMCPQCETCGYWYASELCNHYWWSVVGDNKLSMVYCILMVLWGEYSEM